MGWWLHIIIIKHDLALIVLSFAIRIYFRSQFWLCHALWIFADLLELLDYCMIFSLFVSHVSSIDILPLLLRGGFVEDIMVQHIIQVITNVYILIVNLHILAPLFFKIFHDFAI